MNNTQEVDFIDIYPIDKLESTSKSEAIQPLEEWVAYSEQHFASYEELLTPGTHRIKIYQKRDWKLQIQLLQGPFVYPI